MPIIVYTMGASPPARTVLATAELLGLDIETRNIDILENEHLTEEYVKKNPLHTVPLLEDEDLVLADSHAIAIYLITKYGTVSSEGLYPSDVKERAVVNQRLFFDASILFPRLGAAEKDIFYGTATSTNEEKAASIREAYGFLEKYLERSTFVAGENISIADISCVTTVTTLNIVVPLDDQYPKVQAWLEYLSKQKWYQNQNQPGLNDFARLFQLQLEKNAKLV